MAGPTSFIDQAIDNIRSNKTVKIFSNVRRCFLKVEELIKVYEMLLKSKNYGTYNLTSPMVAYYERIVQICKNKKISYEQLLVPTIGNIAPLEQDIDSSKFKRVFKLTMN